MRTILITGAGSLPDELRELIERGSTSLVEHRAAELAGNRAGSAPGLDADRIVFWTATGDADVERLAEVFARNGEASRGDVILFITGEGAPPPPALRWSPQDVFVWPRDEDRLKMAFLTGG